MNRQNSEFLSLRNDILACRDCEKRFGFSPIPIFFGNNYSKIFQISQAPSNNVHITHKPFDDITGRKLKYQWYQITDDVFYNEDNFFITALAHCFPGKGRNGGDKTPPISCAKKWLWKEIDIINNKLYIIIGKKAAKFLFPNTDYTELIFRNNELNGKLAIVLPHPSPLNIKWFKDNPRFETERLPYIRSTVREILN